MRQYLVSVFKKVWLRMYYALAFLLKGVKQNKLLRIRPVGSRSAVFLRGGTTDMNSFFQVFFDKQYEVNLGFEPKTIIDCGANVGLATVYFKDRYPKARIICVEPEPSCFAMLQRNTENLANVQCLHAGVWNKNTSLVIESCEHGLWSCMVKEAAGQSPDTIPAFSIDSIMQQYGLDHIDVLKIDIEGSEKELFGINFERWLGHVNVLIIEFHDSMRAGASRSVFNALSNYNYSLHTRAENFVIHIHR